MPQNSDINAAIDAILQNDIEPPDEEYSPVSFAATFAQSLSGDETRELTRAAIRRLPASLADSILEGVLSVAAQALDPQVLFDAIPSGPQVDSAGTVVRHVVSKLGVTPDVAAAELFRRLSQSSDSHVQNRYSFGLWVLFCGETLVVAENKVVGHLVSRADDEIERQLARRDLSQYAKDTLKECRFASHRGDQLGP